MTWLWLILAFSALAGSGYLIGYASRLDRPTDPDWFWGPDGWTDGTFTRAFYPDDPADPAFQAWADRYAPAKSEVPSE